MVAAIALLMLCMDASAQPQYTKLVWSDEFNTPGLPDASKWAYDTGSGCPQRCGWGNNELQYYTARAENAVVEGGTLRIHAKKEAFQSAAYTSARIKSKGKFDFKYGKIEVRAKLPEGIGTWPAIWMLGSNIDKTGWPACGEIDVMEHRGYELNKIFGTLHYPGRSGDNANGHYLMVNDVTKSFHLYAAEWTEKSIRIYADGKLVHEVANHKDIPFNHDFFIILNVAIGGNFAGPVDPAFQHSTMEVDYVRVYQ